MEKIIVIGVPAGEEEALSEVLAPLPASMPPILIAQQFAEGSMRDITHRLDSLCQISVKEAEDGELLQPGRAYIAQGARHLLLAGRNDRMAVRLAYPAFNHDFSPVNALFRSAAHAGGGRVIGVVLCGLGADAVHGMIEMRRCGSHNIAQDEAGSAGIEIPTQAIALRAVDDVLPLTSISRRLVELSFH